MMKRLLRADLVAKQKSMMQIISRLILAFAFVVSTAHTPAIAHDEPASHHADHKAASAADAIMVHHGDTPSSPEGAGESVHHHHCPSALEGQATDVAIGATSGKALRPLQRATVLTSFSQAPPTEPPSA